MMPETAQIRLRRLLTLNGAGCLSLGLAISARYFDANAPHAQKLVDWLCRLFEL